MNNDASDNAQPPFDDAGSDRVRKLQLVRAGASEFGIFADAIATIVAWREPTPLPHAPKSVLGVASVQGRMLTVLDLASLAAGEATSSSVPGNGPNRASRHLIALRGDEQFALAVEEIGEAIVLGAGEFDGQREKGETGETAGTLVLGIRQREGAEIKILNLQELFPAAIQGRERRRRRF